jgi:hypothetical protein
MPEDGIDVKHAAALLIMAAAIGIQIGIGTEIDEKASAHPG